MKKRKTKKRFLPVSPGSKGSKVIIRAFSITRCKCIYPGGKDDTGGGECNALAYDNDFCHYHDAVKKGHISTPVRYIFLKH